MRPTEVLMRAPSSIRRLRLTTKQAGKDYYKGNRTGSMGTHTKYGGYIIDYNKVRTYVCPDLTGFQLTPFVSAFVEANPKFKVKGKKEGSQGPNDGHTLIAMWKSYGGGI